MLMGLFDLPAPAFSFMDQLLRTVLPAWPRLIFWGLMAGTAATALYALLSPQDQIVKARAEANEARHALLVYDGDFDGVLPLAQRSLRLSFRHLALTSGPALAAALPVLLLFTWLSNAYGYREPSAGAAVTVRVDPAGAAVRWNPPTASAADKGAWRISWPAAGKQVRLSDADGHLLAVFPLRAPIPVVEKFLWWNLFFGNPAGYLPADARVRSVEVGYPGREFLPVGPGWMRGWEVIFFASAALFSIIIRVALGIH
jgi:hypothetical protein